MKRVARLEIGVIIALWAGIYVWGLGAAHIDYSIEALRAVVARTMMENHQWMVPHYRGTLYLAKPPLMNWAIAAFSLPWGRVTEASARLPSVLSVLGLALALRFWARRWGRPRGGFYAAVLLLLLPLVFEKGTRAEIDMNLTLWVGLSLLCLFDGMEQRRQGRSGRGWTLAAYGFLTLAFLSKGPPALLFFLGTWLTYQTIQGWKTVRIAHHLLGWCIALAGVGLWLGPVILSVGWETFWSTFQNEALGRVVEASKTNQAPFYFYPISLLGGALPAVVFLPWLRGFGAEDKLKRVLWFSGCWIGSALVLFSLVAGKESRYLLPVYPAIALLGGFAFERFLDQIQSEDKGRLGRILLAGFAVGVVICGPALGIAQRKMNPDLTALGVVWAVLWSLSGAFSLVFQKRRNWRFAVAVLAAALLAAKGFHMTAYVPDRNARKSPKQLCQQIHQRVPAGTSVDLIDIDKTYIDFYLERPYRYSPNMEAFLDRSLPEGPYYLLLRDKDSAAEFLSRLEQRATIRESQPVFQGERRFLLITVDRLSSRARS